MKQHIVKIGFVLAFGAALACAHNFALADSAVKQVPLCRVDVTKLGFPQSRYSGAEPKVSLSRFKIDFQNDSALVLSWVTADEPLPHLPKRKKFSRPPVVPAHLHLLFVDATTGTELREKNLSVPSAPTSVFVNHSGNLIVSAGDSVRLYSPDFAVMNEAKFPLPIDLSSINSGSRVEISPDGQRLALCSEQGITATVEIFDSDTLQLLGSLPEQPKGCPWQISHNQFLAATGKVEALIPPGTAETATGTLPQASMQGHSRQPVQLINGDTKVIFEGSYIEFRSGDGEILESDTLPKKHLFVPLGATARETGRFAVLIARMRGLTIPNLDMYAFPSAEQVAVYDIRTAKRVFTMDVKGSSPWSPWKFVSNHFVLSPNGSLLAVLSDGLLSVYQLP